MEPREGPRQGLDGFGERDGPMNWESAWLRANEAGGPGSKPNMAGQAGPEAEEGG